MAPLLVAALAWSAPAPADPGGLRLASFHSDLSRAGPGLLLADLLDPEPDAQIRAVIAVIAGAGADVLLLQGVDYDAGGHALTALAGLLERAGAPYPYLLALRPNTGRPTGLDLDGNGRTGEARDAQGFGWFNGQGGMAILSRLPIVGDAVRDHSGFLWADLPESSAPLVLSPEALALQRLASVAAWDVPLVLPSGGQLHILALHAGPPIFDGPEDRNGLRNADELGFWRHYLDGWSPDGVPFAARDFALMGVLNLDPDRGEGRRGALEALLRHPRLQDPAPQRPMGGHNTVDWPEPVPGDLRVSYILPAAGLRVTGAGILWPAGEDAVPPLSVVEAASAHRLVWVDLDF